MTSSQQSIAIIQDRVRVAILLYPKDGLTFEEFDNYWVNNHGALFASLAIVKTNLTKYEQFHFDPALNKSFVERGMVGIPYWGMAVFEAESYEKLFAVFENPEYLEKIVPDEQNFIAREKSSMVAGRFAGFAGN